MKKRTIPCLRTAQRFLYALFLLTLALQSCKIHTNEVGEKLLDDYIKATTFKRARDVSTRKMFADLEELDARAQADRKRVSEEFYFRYRRLIDTTRAVITEGEDDNRRAKVVEYVTGITGKTPDDRDLIPAAAEAFTVEVSRLRALLRQ